VVAKKTTKRSQPTLEDEIRRRAYELYEARGCQDGHALDDWLRAEAYVRGTLAQPPQPTVKRSPPKSPSKRVAKSK